LIPGTDEKVLPFFSKLKCRLTFCRGRDNNSAVFYFLIKCSHREHIREDNKKPLSILIAVLGDVLKGSFALELNTAKYL